MKVLILLVSGMLLAGSALGQGTVVFANTASPDFRILTWNHLGHGPITGTNQWRIGLYAGPRGTSENSLVLAGLATNLANPALAGYFSGGNPFALPGPYDLGDTITFQVRVWAFAGGLSFEESLRNGYLVGKSSLGFVTLGGGIVFPGSLFGTNSGQIGGFSAFAIPEPSTYALGLLGVALFGLLRRKQR